MNALIDSVIAFQNLMKQAGIPVMAIGGIAVAVWGEPRLTRDIDFKVLLHREDRARLLELLRDLTPLQENPDDSFRRLGLAFFQDANGVRLDVMLADTIFDETALERARQVEFAPGKTIWVCAPEDLIIYKMLSTRPKDRSDAESVIRRQGQALDEAYIEGWLRQFEQALSDSTLVSEFRKLRG
ncbi:MAG: DUF6036 family nucleotidyltransferase [Anaerolineales bacterium]|nr:DUF6036 family nucleotidyltransferase [Anaerolineales bacterium]